MKYYAVIDLEMCKVSHENYKKFGRAHELIQIGAVLVDENFEITDSFMTYVKPQYGEIDEFIQNLTGITQENVSDAPSSEQAFEKFAQWLPEDVTAVSWSDTDYYQICDELDGKNIDNQRMEDLLETWIDCQYTFGKKMNNPDKCYRLSEALNLSDISFDEGAHDALVDAKNTALLFIKMEKEPVFKTSPYLIIKD